MKKLTLCISVLFMLIGLSSMNAEEVVIGINDTIQADAFAGGQGTAADPYQISNFRELIRFSETATSGSYSLIADIDASLSSEMDNLYPQIATFSGNLNGNGFVIDGFNSNRAFFHIVTGTISSLGFTNLLVVGTKTGNGTASEKNMGGIAHYLNLGTLEKCFVKGEVTGMQNAGMLIGNNSTGQGSKIENCYAIGKSTKTNGDLKANTGGLVGQCNNKIFLTNCFFSGDTYKPIGKLGNSNSVVLGCYYDKTGTYGLLPASTPVLDNPGLPLTAAEMALSTSYSGWDFETVWEIKDGVPALRKPMYTVAFDCNPAYGTITGATSGSYASGISFTPTATASNGATFEGWYLNGTKIDAATATYAYTNGMSDVTLYAHFTTTTSIQDLYYYNGFNSVGELVVTGKNAYAADWSGYQGGSTDGGTFVTEGTETYNMIHWNTDALYYGDTDRADVQMEMSFQTTSASTGIDFLLRAANTNTGSNDRKTAINVELATKYVGEDSIIVKLNTSNVCATAGLGFELQEDVEYKFMVSLVDTTLCAWVAEAGADYPTNAQLSYPITGDEGFQSTGIYGFGISEGDSAIINYFVAGAPNTVSIPTAMQDVAKEVSLINIYPNPARDFFTVATTDVVTVSVIDLSGKTVIASQMVNGSQNISISSLSSGLYLVKVGAELTKLIVE